MNFSWLDNALWGASLVGHAALILVLFLRKRVREFPIFTGFIAYEVFTTILLFFISRDGTRHGYFLAYWITGFGDYPFQIAVIFEIARHVLRPTGTWVRDARRTFLAWGTGILLFAAVLSLQLGPPQSRGVDLWDSRITLFTSLLTVGVFIAMAAAATRLGLPWRSHAFALGQGLAIWATISLMEDFGHVLLGWNRDFLVLVHVRMFAYLVVLLYWIVTFWIPEKQRPPLSPEMHAYLLALHRKVQYDLEGIDGRNL